MRTDLSSYYPGSIDSHAHIHLLERKELDPDAVLSAAAAAGMGALIDVGVEPSDYHGRRTRFAGRPLLAFTAGLHPTSVTPERAPAELALLESILETASGDPVGAGPVAVGEIGLDFYWSIEHRTLQIESLERQFALASRFGLPVIIHNRESDAQMLDALTLARPTGVMHCFSQDPAYCRACLDLGMMISFGGNLTYRRSEQIREAARLVPEDRLLVETDSPYLSPQAVRGRPNHPGHLAFVIDALAEIRGDSPQHIAGTTAQNARSLFGV